MISSQLKVATNATLSNAEKFLTVINDSCELNLINTPVRMLNFLAQLGHESGGLFFTEELSSGKAYEGRPDLGNTQPGDGPRYKGRGLIQITGRSNYTAVGLALGQDFVSNPTLLGGKNASLCTPDQLRNAAMSAGWFWKEHDLNALSDLIDIHSPIDQGNNLATFKNITRRINGGLNGLPDRLSRYISGLPMFV